MIFNGSFYTLSYEYRFQSVTMNLFSSENVGNVIKTCYELEWEISLSEQGVFPKLRLTFVDIVSFYSIIFSRLSQTR